MDPGIKLGKTSNQGLTVNSTQVLGPATQITESEGHHWPPPRGGLAGDLGGEFFTTRSYVLSDGCIRGRKFKTYERGYPWIQYHFDGDVSLVNPTNVSYPPSMHSSNTELDAYGAEAIARCKPTNSVADVATFLGELYKEGIPRLVGSQTWKDRTLTAKNAGGEYLNVAFGWLPIINEVKDFAKAVRKADAVLAQYERDAGRVVRRRFNFPIEKTNSTVLVKTGTDVTPYSNPSGGGLLWVGHGYLYRHREVTRRKWFSGAFTYTLPRGYDSRNALSRYAARSEILFGTTPTPETLWNLAPWSWAVDWFTNAGDVISNVTDYVSAGLVMRYGYLMEHTIVKDTYTLVNVETQDVTSPFLRSTQFPPLTLVTETKVRRKANPFGFGITWDGLSPFQISILAALGMSRSR